MQVIQREQERRSFPLWLSRVTPAWRWDWPYLRYVQAHLDKVTAGKIDRLMLFLPPRHGKTEMTTIRYPVWRLERRPEMRVIIGAYNQLLANKFSRKARRIAEQRLELAQDHMAVEDWETATGGGIRAVGVGSGITGQGGHLIVIDDPVKSRKEAESPTYREAVWDWYTDDIYTRLEPGGAIVLIQTRWHEDDLAGRILASEDAASWTVVSLPAEAEENDPLGRVPGEALCPDRYPVEVLARIRTVLGSLSYYALYQQRPQPETGAVLQRQWFPRRGPIDRRFATWVIQAWDTAYEEGQESDYSACLTLGVQPPWIYVLDAWRARIETPELLRQMKAKYEQWRPNVVLVEDRGSGKTSKQTLRAQTLLPIVGVQPVGSKVARAKLVTGMCEAGRVIIPPVPWGDDLLDELVRFPSGPHDDQVDAFVYALRYVIDHAADMSVSEY